MTPQRLRFLASLSERLESDLAARERNRDDDPSPLARLEHIGLPGGGHEPAPEDEVAGDEIVGAPGDPAAPIETEQDAGSRAVAPPQHGRVPLSGAFVSGEGESTLRPSVPWSETGMPLRLREAIASVRRVSNEMQDVPPDDYAARGPEPYRDHAGYPNDPWDDEAADRAPPEDSQALLEPDPAPEDRQIHPGHDAAYDEPPPQDERELLDEAAGFRHEPMPLDDDDAIYDEPPPDDDLVLLEDDVVREDRPPSFGGPAGYQEPSPDDEPSGLDDDEAYRHGHMRLDDDAVYEERAPADAAAHEHLWLEGDGADPEAAPGRGNAPHERPVLRRGATTGYGVHAAAFAIAITVVALAGFGLGILSGAGEVGEPVARGTVKAAPPQPAPFSTGQSAQPPEREKPPELSELITERVAPAQVAAVPGPPPAPRVSRSALPLPPPPKPVLRQSAAAQPASTDEEPARAVDAAAAPLETDGVGGPFEPLFAKLPASGPRRTQIFVHYTASAVGAPATAMHLVRRLKSEGFAAEARPVEFAIPTNSIRYFFESDREQAETLRASLEGQLPAGAAPSVTDFTSYEPKPRPGLIEIWLRA